MESWLLLLLLLLSSRVDSSSSQSIVETLPGYAGTLPFKLETGYVGVGENEQVQLFYYFIESENDPLRDPLVLWLTGGPGCSGFSGLVYEIGPLLFDVENFDGSLPSLYINQYSWTKVASIIFIDSPVGTGFSYTNTSESYASSETKAAFDTYVFLRKWLSIHPSFQKNRLYIAGDSQGGIIVPMVALEIAEGNEDGVEPKMLLQGYIVGNPLTDANIDGNAKVPYAHRLAIISDQYYEAAKSSCDGEYENPDPSNLLCSYALQVIQQCVTPLNDAHVLEPKCQFLSPRPNDDSRWGESFLRDDPIDLLMLKSEELRCRNHNYITSYVWANDESVQEALHIRQGTKGVWKRCNKTLDYEQNVHTVVKHHQILNEKGFQALVYSGDHDMVIPYLGTLNWIRLLNLTIDEQWRPWTVDGQVAGYTEKHKRNQAYITFATVKGAGHTAPEYKPRESLGMIKRWISGFPL